MVSGPIPTSRLVEIGSWGRRPASIVLRCCHRHGRVMGTACAGTQNIHLTESPLLGSRRWAACCAGIAVRAVKAGRSGGESGKRGRLGTALAGRASFRHSATRLTRSACSRDSQDNYRQLLHVKLVLVRLYTILGTGSSLFPSFGCLLFCVRIGPSGVPIPQPAPRSPPRAWGHGLWSSEGRDSHTETVFPHPNECNELRTDRQLTVGLPLSRGTGLQGREGRGCRLDPSPLGGRWAASYAMSGTLAAPS